MTFAAIRAFALLTAALVLVVGPAAAQPAAAPVRTYAVVSLIGDQFSIVTRRPQDKKPANHSWDAMTAKEKVDALEHVIRKAVASGMAGVLAP